MKRSEKKLINKVETGVKEIVKERPVGNDREIEKLVEEIEENRMFRVKDYNYAINYFMDKELKVYKTEEDTNIIKEESLVYDLSKRVIEKAIKYRRSKNNETSKVDTNILTHAPYFVGGSRKRKKKGLEERYILIEKGGLRKLTYENDLGIMLTMVDAKTLFALFSLWEEQNYPEWLSFTEYKLLNKMGMSDGGNQYRNIRNSLEKLRNTSVILREAYDIETGTREVTNRFKLIIADKFTEDFDYTGKLSSKQYDIQFSPHIVTSLKKGYYSLISLTVFNDLEIETAQGLYLMFIGIDNMDRKDEYYTSKGEYIISLEKVYETLFIESNKYMRKSIIEKGCEELKDVGVLKDYYFKNVGSKNEKLVMCPTEWQEDLLGKRGAVKEIGKEYN